MWSTGPWTKRPQGKSDFFGQDIPVGGAQLIPCFLTTIRVPNVNLFLERPFQHRCYSNYFQSFQKVTGIPWWSSGCDSTAGAEAQPLIGELRSPKPYAAAAKSLQSCPTLWDPIDGSPPGFPIPGILAQPNNNNYNDNKIYSIFSFQIEYGRLNISIYLYSVHKTPLNDSKGIKRKDMFLLTKQESRKQQPSRDKGTLMLQNPGKAQEF